MEINERVSWNLAEALIIQLGNLLAQSNSNYLNGRIDKAFFCLKVIRQRIIQSLKPDERKQIIELEKEFVGNGFSKVNQIKEYQNQKQKQMVVYEKYNTLIMDFLEKYGYLIKKQEDDTRINV